MSELTPFEGPPLVETFITPLGARVEKLSTPTGNITLLKILTPAQVFTIKFEQDDAIELATALTGGIQKASVADLIKLK